MWRCLFFFPVLCVAQQPTPTLRWYNGDWQPAIPGMSNWYVSDQQFGRTFDDFAVPLDGWTVTSVFSNNSMSPDGVTDASWEIRTGLATGNPGTIFAAGRGPATLTKGSLVGNGVYTYRVQVDGLSVQLPPGRYWLSVTPVTADPKTYLCATLGVNALGDPPGNDRNAFYSTSGGLFISSEGTGQGGTSGDYSLGVFATPAPATLESGWRSNVTALVQQMTALHSQPYPGISVSDFNAAATDLWSRIPTLSDPLARTAFEKLVASINHPHTSVSYPSPSPFQMLPLSFYWFDDGIYVTGAAARYKALLGAKLVRVGGHRLDTVIAQLTPLIAHDNDSWVRYVLPQRLVNVDFLYGTGIAQTPDRVEIEVDTGMRSVPSIHHRRGGASHFASMVVTADRAPMLPVYTGPLPLARQHTDKPYWSTLLDNGATVYFQYNSCREDPAQPSADFLAALDKTLAQSSVRRLIFDMRNNTGGSATILDPWILALKSSRFNRAGRLYVIVGRATFSAAMEATNLLHDNTAAVFVGEPTGAKPRFLLRKGDFPVPYFGIRVSYSNGTENASLAGPSLIPDIPAPVTFRDYMTGIDPALDSILRIPPPVD